MDYRLEVIGVPVSDVDQAKAFYVDAVGFHLDHDVEPGPGMRVVQLTPPGSPCSIVIGRGLPLGEPGSTKGLQLVVDDVDAARSELARRGVEISETQQLGPEGTPGLALRLLQRSGRQRLVTTGDQADLTGTPAHGLRAGRCPAGRRWEFRPDPTS